jgi:hypothetical protein
MGDESELTPMKTKIQRNEQEVKSRAVKAGTAKRKNIVSLWNALLIDIVWVVINLFEIG